MRFSYFIYLIIFMFIFLGVTLRQSDIRNDNERNIFNYSENTLSKAWNSSLWEIKELNNTNISMEEAFTYRARNSVYKFIDFVGYSSFQALKLGMEFGYEKAYKYNPESFVKLAKLLFIVIIISFIIPIIVPVLALLYLLFESFKWLIIAIKNKRGQNGNRKNSDA